MYTWFLYWYKACICLILHQVPYQAATGIRLVFPQVIPDWYVRQYQYVRIPVLYTYPEVVPTGPTLIKVVTLERDRECLESECRAWVLDEVCLLERAILAPRKAFLAVLDLFCTSRSGLRNVEKSLWIDRVLSAYILTHLVQLCVTCGLFCRQKLFFLEFALFCTGHVQLQRHLWDQYFGAVDHSVCAERLADFFCLLASCLLVWSCCWNWWR